MKLTFCLVVFTCFSKRFWFDTKCHLIKCHGNSLQLFYLWQHLQYGRMIFSLAGKPRWVLNCDWQIMTGPLLEAWKGKGQSSSGSDICVTTATGIKLPRRLQVVDFKQGWRQLTWALPFLERSKSSFNNGKKKKKSYIMFFFMCYPMWKQCLCTYLPNDSKPLSPRRLNSSHQLKSMVSVFTSIACCFHLLFIDA